MAIDLLIGTRMMNEIKKDNECYQLDLNGILGGRREWSAEELILLFRADVLIPSALTALPFRNGSP